METARQEIARKRPLPAVARRRRGTLARIGGFAALLCMAQAPAHAAATFPERPVQMTVSVGAGGSTDTIMRALVKYAEPHLGQPVVIINKPGASGMIGVADVTRAKPDGYTIGGTWSGPLTMAPHIATATYTPADYVIVAMVSEAPGVLCVRSDFPAGNARELLDTLRKDPDKYTYGSDGVGGFVQFATERVLAAAKVKARVIPFSGANQTVTAFLSGDIDIYGGAITTVLPFVKQGKAKCLLTTSAKRYPVLPDVDSLTDVGLADTQTLLWRAVIAPAGLPADRLVKLKEAFGKAVQDPGFAKIAESLGEEPWRLDVNDVDQYSRTEFDTMKRLADELALKNKN